MFWQFATLGAMMPLLPVYFRSLGVTASDILLLGAIQSAGSLLTGQLWGYVADVYVKRTTLTLWLGLATALVAATFPLLPSTLYGLGCGVLGIAFFFSPRMMLYNVLVLESRRGEELYGKIRMIGSGSFVLGALLVGKLADSPVFGIAVVWVVVTALEVVSAMSIVCLRDEPPSRRVSGDKQKIGFREAQRRLLANPVFSRFLIFCFVMQFFHLPGQGIQSAFLVELKSTSLFATICVSVAAAFELTVFYFGRQILARFRLMPMIGSIPIFVAIRWGLVWLFPVPMTVLLVSMLHMFCFGLCYLCAMIMVNRESPPELRSSGQTIFGVVFSSLSNLAGSLASAALLAWLGHIWPGDQLAAIRALYGISAVGVLLSFLAFFPLKRAYEARHGVSGVFAKS